MKAKNDIFFFFRVKCFLVFFLLLTLENMPEILNCKQALISCLGKPFAESVNKTVAVVKEISRFHVNWMRLFCKQMDMNEVYEI